VSLPLPWSRRFDIDKKRELTLEETSDGVLTIVPGDMKRIEEEATIPITNNATPDKIYYKILKAYFDGYKIITLVGNLTDEQMDFIDIIHKRVVGLEVTEQKKDQIILTDLLRPEDVDLDKIISQMFSFISVVTTDIISHIEQNKQPGDKILDRDSVTTRNHNLAYRCCNMALKDSMYLSKLKKTTSEILIISRIIRYLDMLGTILVGGSYLINIEMTEGMKKYHYKIFEEDEKLNKTLEKYLKKWLQYLKSIKTALKEKDIEKATDLYLRRFEFRLEMKDRNGKSGEHLANIIDFSEQLNRMSSLILRDFMMY